MIYFVRHGETDYNVSHIMQGQLNIPLNENGINQAKQASEDLKDVKIDEIFSSPLIRALKTAEIINKYHNLTIKTDNRLKELFAGSMQGMCLNTLSTDEKQEYMNNPKKFNAESWQEFYDRVVSFFKEIEHSEKNILIVSHGGVYRNIYKYLNNIKGFHFELEDIKNSKVIILNTSSKKEG